MSLAALVSHPSILRAAWQKVDRWYRATELKPEPEYSHWQIHWEDELQILGDELAANTYLPSEFPLVPYPKKGAIIRHYTMPSVKDQVAFAVFANLLAPLCEIQMPNVSYGNRWFRSVYRKKKPGKPEDYEWAKRPFSLADRTFYEPYRRSHGLFRRVAHWTAAALLGTEIGSSSIDEMLSPDDYPTEALPQFVNEGWWSDKEKGKRRGYWLQGDLQLAYPSVKIEELARRLKELVGLKFLESFALEERTGKLFGFSPTLGESISQLSGLPSAVVFELLDQLSLREDLADRLSFLLSKVKYSGGTDAWLPPHADQELPIFGSSHVGLPTGLAVSGFLMNVYLNKLDTGMCEWLTGTLDGGFGRAAYLRFADDFMILADSKEVIAQAIDIFWSHLAGSTAAVVSDPAFENVTNLRINWTKTKPDSWSEIINDFRKDKGWLQCDRCETFEAPKTADREKFSAWWARKQQTTSIHERQKNKLEQDALTASSLGPFVTYLVERLSEIGNDSLLNRFGQLSVDRLRELHSLVRTSLDDGQIRDDTRLSFAINRLADTWLPDESAEGGSVLIQEIRRSASECLSKAPWKFQMWRSIIRCAVRRPPELDASHESWSAEQLKAENWLKEMLSRISVNSEADESWQPIWPEDIKHFDCRKNQDWKDDYLSFLRTSFWSALADVLTDLQRMAAAVDTQADNDNQAFHKWNSKSWIFRISSEAQIRPAFEWLSDLEPWARVLYGPSASLERELPQFEVTAIMKAMLACETRSDLLKSMRSSTVYSFAVDSNVDADLVLPPDVASKKSPTLSVLTGNRQALIYQKLQLADVKTSAWPLLLMAAYDSQCSGEIASILNSLPPQKNANFLTVAKVFGVTKFLTTIVARKRTVFEKGRVSPSELESLLPQGTSPKERQAALFDYANIRQAYHAKMENPANRVDGNAGSIHTLLWGPAWDSRDFSEWRVLPWEAPEIGLPVSVAMTMLGNILEQLDLSDFPSKAGHDRRAPLPPVWTIAMPARDLLASGRRKQIVPFEPATIPNEETRSNPLVQEGIKSSDWDVLPHPAYFLPWALGLVNGHSQKHRIWCHCLTFMTALEGSERILESIWSNGGPGAVPFEERWDMRNRIHLPTEIWIELTKLQSWFASDTNWSDTEVTSALATMGALPENRVQAVVANLTKAFEDLDKYPIGLEDFDWQRVDISLELANDFEILRSVRRWNSSEQYPALRTDLLSDSLAARLAQVSACPDWAFRSNLPNPYFTNFPHLWRVEVQTIMRQVWAAFLTETQQHRPIQNVVARQSHSGPIIIFPELILPPSETRDVVRLVTKTNRAALIGMQLKVLNNGLGHPISGSGIRRFIVNEAMLAVPLFLGSSRIGPLVRQFFIRKPTPSYIELGLAAALNRARVSSGDSFSFTPGQTWYRFMHPEWGDFSIAICADIINPKPWASMRSNLLHIFMCACNTDVELFDSLTWVRAYENYVNIVSTNHGMHGGSFAWTPKHQSSRELARLRGANVFLVADIDLPVQELLRAQIFGVNEAVMYQEQKWLGNSKHRTDKYKSPPPGYNPR